jgi:Protein of unknown function (DUF3500)
VRDGERSTPRRVLVAFPTRVPSGPLEGQRVLGAQEDLARELVRGFDPAARARAILGARSLGDIVTGPGRGDALRTPVGVAIGEMGGPQRALAERPIDEFVGNLHYQTGHRHGGAP